MTNPLQVWLQWSSGRIEAYPTRFELPTAIKLARELSRCSPSIERAWVEAPDGQLIYVAVKGRGLIARHASEAPMG